MLHKSMPAAERHAPWSWEYADAAARTSATGFVAADVGKVALQLNDVTAWVLTSHSPIVWAPMGSGSGGGGGPAGAGASMFPGDTLLTARTLEAPEWLPLNGASYLSATYEALSSLFAPPTGVKWDAISSGSSANIRTVTPGAAGVWFLGADGGVMRKSLDDGSTWSSLSPGFGSADIYGIAYCPPSTIVAGGGGGTIRRSTDGGENWTTVTSANTNIVHIARASNGTLLNVGATIARSTDDGATWTAVAHGFPSFVRYATHVLGKWIACGESGAMRQSTDDGITWSAMSPGFGSTSIRALMSPSSGVLLAAGLGGVMRRSSDSGATWSAVTPGFGSGDIYVLGKVGSIVIAGGAGLRYSADDGVTWSAATPSTGTYTALAVNAEGVCLLGSPGGAGKRSPSASFTLPTVTPAEGLKHYIYTGVTP